MKYVETKKEKVTVHVQNTKYKIKKKEQEKIKKGGIKQENENFKKKIVSNVMLL